jgi:hypothetical protein
MRWSDDLPFFVALWRTNTSAWGGLSSLRPPHNAQSANRAS